MILADGRRNNGGNKNAGRKSKAEEQKVIETLSPLHAKAIAAFELGLNGGE